MRRFGLDALSADMPVVVFDELHKYPRWKSFLKGFSTSTGARHAFQAVFSEPFVQADCFSRTDPVVVPARTLFSQLVQRANAGDQGLADLRRSASMVRRSRTSFVSIALDTAHGEPITRTSFLPRVIAV